MHVSHINSLKNRTPSTGLCMKVYLAASGGDILECNCDSTKTHPSIVVSPGCSHQLWFCPLANMFELVAGASATTARNIYCIDNLAQRAKNVKEAL